MMGNAMVHEEKIEIQIEEYVFGHKGGMGQIGCSPDLSEDDIVFLYDAIEIFQGPMTWEYEKWGLSWCRLPSGKISISAIFPDSDLGGRSTVVGNCLIISGNDFEKIHFNPFLLMDLECFNSTKNRPDIIPPRTVSISQADIARNFKKLRNDDITADSFSTVLDLVLTCREIYCCTHQPANKLLRNIIYALPGFARKYFSFSTIEPFNRQDKVLSQSASKRKINFTAVPLKMAKKLSSLNLCSVFVYENDLLEPVGRATLSSPTEYSALIGDLLKKRDLCLFDLFQQAERDRLLQDSSPTEFINVIEIFYLKRPGPLFERLKRLKDKDVSQELLLVNCLKTLEECSISEDIFKIHKLIGDTLTDSTNMQDKYWERIKQLYIEKIKGNLETYSRLVQGINRFPDILQNKFKREILPLICTDSKKYAKKESMPRLLEVLINSPWFDNPRVLDLIGYVLERDPDMGTVGRAIMDIFGNGTYARIGQLLEILKRFESYKRYQLDIEDQLNKKDDIFGYADLLMRKIGFNEGFHFCRTITFIPSLQKDAFFEYIKNARRYDESSDKQFVDWIRRLIYNYINALSPEQKKILSQYDIEVPASEILHTALSDNKSDNLTKSSRRLEKNKKDAVNYAGNASINSNKYCDMIIKVLIVACLFVSYELIMISSENYDYSIVNQLITAVSPASPQSQNLNLKMREPRASFYTTSFPSNIQEYPKETEVQSDWPSENTNIQNQSQTQSGIAPGLGKLYINVVPERIRKSITIRVMNFKPKYRRGMELLPGKYTIHIEDNTNQYETTEKIISLETESDPFEIEFEFVKKQDTDSVKHNRAIMENKKNITQSNKVSEEVPQKQLPVALASKKEEKLNNDFDNYDFYKSHDVVVAPMQNKDPVRADRVHNSSGEVSVNQSEQARYVLTVQTKDQKKSKCFNDRTDTLLSADILQTLVKEGFSNTDKVSLQWHKKGSSDPDRTIPFQPGLFGLINIAEKEYFIRAWQQNHPFIDFKQSYKEGFAPDRIFLQLGSLFTHELNSGSHRFDLKKFVDCSKIKHAQQTKFTGHIIAQKFKGNEMVDLVQSEPFKVLFKKADFKFFDASDNLLFTRFRSKPLIIQSDFEDLWQHKIDHGNTVNVKVDGQSFDQKIEYGNAEIKILNQTKDDLKIFCNFFSHLKIDVFPIIMPVGISSKSFEPNNKEFVESIPLSKLINQSEIYIEFRKKRDDFSKSLFSSNKLPIHQAN